QQVPAFVDSLQGEIDNHNAIFLYDTEQQEKSDHAVERQGRSKNPKSEQTADYRGNDRRKQHRDRMDITFVKNSQDHIHDEDRADQKQWQRGEKLSKDKRFTLERRLHSRILTVNLGKRIFDNLGRIADGNVR